MPREPIPQEKIDEQFWTPQQSVAPKEPASVSLAELGKRVYPAPAGPEVSAKTDALKRAGVGSLRGDDLIAKAQGMNSFGDEEKTYINRFADSKKILDLKMQSDPEFSETTIKRLQNLTGEKLSNAIIDAADEVKIKHLEEKYPGRFGAGDALVTGLLDEAAFGQLSKIYGKAGELLQGRPYEEVVKEKAEEIRLLQKAHPNMDLVGRAASYFIPGSPAKALFSAMSKVGLKIGGGILTRVANNPKLLQTAVQAVGNGGFELGAKVLESAGVGAATSAAQGLIKGTLGQDLESVSLDRGIENSLLSGAAGFVAGGAVPALAAGAQKIANVARPAVNSASKSVQSGLAGLIEATSGVSRDALRAYNRDAKALRVGYGKEFQIGQRLVDKLDELDAFKLPERVQADELLHQMGQIEVKGFVDSMKNLPKNIRPDLKNAYNTIATEWAPYVESKLGNKTKVSPAAFREIIDDFQQAAKKTYGKDPNAAGILDMVKGYAAEARQSLLNHAGEHGEVGKTYINLMEKVAEKRGVVDDLQRMLGKDDFTRARKAEGFISNLFGKNRGLEEARLADLDKIYGTNFLETSRVARQASAVGAKGTPAALAQYATGKTLLGTGVGTAAGSALDAVTGNDSNTGRNFGAGVGLLFSSPAAAAKLLGASDSITGFARRVFARPEVLQRLAKGSVRGFPIEVQRVAKLIQDSLVKDGPVSAAGVMRIVADTPLFLGLVHAHDLAERRMDNDTARSALSKQRQQSQGIARPNQ